MSTMSARELNQDVSVAKRRANDGPVVITDRGVPAYVLMTIEDYHRREGRGDLLVQRLSMDDDLDIEFEAVHLDLKAPEL